MSTRKRIEPILVEVSLRNAIARELRKRNIPAFDDIATSVVSSLVGEPVVPPPAGVPHTFVFNGVRLIWPHGLDTRVPLDAERERFNRALSSPRPGHPGLSMSNDRITDEDNVRVMRACYQALWSVVRIQATERAEQLSLPEPTAPVVTTSMLEGRNPVLEAHVVVKPKRTRKAKAKVESTQETLDALEADQPGTVEYAYEQKIQPIVPVQDTLSGLEATLAELRVTLQV